MSENKFYKGILEVGDYVSNVSIYGSDNEEVKLYDLITDHLLLFCFTTDCESCLSSIEALDIYLSKITNNTYNVAVLIHTDNINLPVFKTFFGEKIPKIYTVPKDTMLKKLRIRYFPRGYALNKLGQVLRENGATSDYWLEKLLEPISILPSQNLSEVAGSSEIGGQIACP
ncbi:hypothetical protein [Paenibacillus puerhi]|uniref:hypothetical protein n=1 Tax=Paenibacillus puerhi TaxID=2692622 RepID=UPI001F3E91DE|nr:hypothetical protein [Paenibacillus puerhi]